MPPRPHRYDAIHRDFPWVKGLDSACLQKIGWVLNMGGRHGTPAIATPDNITAVRIPKSKR